MLCSICHDDDDTSLSSKVTLPCGHAFHGECIAKWFWFGRTSCPNCNAVPRNGDEISEDADFGDDNNTSFEDDIVLEILERSEQKRRLSRVLRDASLNKSSLGLKKLRSRHFELKRKQKDIKSETKIQTELLSRQQRHISRTKIALYNEYKSTLKETERTLTFNLVKPILLNMRKIRRRELRTSKAISCVEEELLQHYV